MNKYKIQHAFFRLVGVIDVSLLFMLFLFISYTAMQNTERQLTFIQDEEKKIDLSLSTILDTAKDTAQATLQSMNYLVFCNCSEQGKLNRYANKVTASLRNELFQYAEVEGIFLYNSACDAFYPCYRGMNFSRLRDELRQLHKTTLDGEQTNRWLITLLEDKPHAFYLTHRRYGSMLLMVDLQKNSKYLETRERLEPVEETTFEFVQHPAEPPRHFVSAHIPIRSVDDLSLVYTARAKSPLQAFSKTQWILFSIIFLLLGLVQIAFFYFQRLTYRPLREISNSLDKIASGDFDYRIQAPTDIYEIVQLSDTINHMLDQIERYKTDSFNLRMDAVQAKLQYLQLQIRPHFYKNCFKNVYSLMEIQEYEKAKQTILAFSDYVGYSFRDVKNFIPLQEELSAVQNYVNLCNIMRRDVELNFSLDTACLPCNFLPMSVLTFVENSLKHRKVWGILHIDIRSDIFLHPDTGKKMVRVTIEDDGGGFPEETLTSLRQADVTQLVYQPHQIGITNVRYRLWLIYGKSATVTFANRDYRAIVQITLPYELQPKNDF